MLAAFLLKGASFLARLSRPWWVLPYFLSMTRIRAHPFLPTPGRYQQAGSRVMTVTGSWRERQLDRLGQVADSDGQ